VLPLGGDVVIELPPESATVPDQLFGATVQWNNAVPDATGAKGSGVTCVQVMLVEASGGLVMVIDGRVKVAASAPDAKSSNQSARKRLIR
jgi:hypothetical protein